MALQLFYASRSFLRRLFRYKVILTLKDFLCPLRLTHSSMALLVLYGLSFVCISLLSMVRQAIYALRCFLWLSQRSMAVFAFYGFIACYGSPNVCNCFPCLLWLFQLSMTPPVSYCVSFFL